MKDLLSLILLVIMYIVHSIVEIITGLFETIASIFH